MIRTSELCLDNKAKSEVRKCICWMELELDLGEILMSISDENNKNEEYANVDLKKSEFDTAGDQ